MKKSEINNVYESNTVRNFNTSNFKTWNPNINSIQNQTKPNNFNNFDQFRSVFIEFLNLNS